MNKNAWILEFDSLVIVSYGEQMAQIRTNIRNLFDLCLDSMFLSSSSPLE